MHGTAVLDGLSLRWSLIEKVTERPDVASEYLYDNGMREFRAYQSGLLGDLAPGMVAPRAYGFQESADGTLTLWLEDVSPSERWAPEQFIDTARHLGRFAGRWLHRPPEYPWLFRDWIDRHSQPAAVADGLEIIQATRGRSDIEGRLEPGLQDAALLIEDQPLYRSALEGLPQTLCHHDAVRANLFSRVRYGARETVAIDWEMVGPGAIGADLASLLFSSVRRGDLSTASLLAIKPRALEAYAVGATEMGAAVEPTEVRLGFSAAVSLRWSLVRDVVVALASGRPVRRGSAPQEPPETALDELVALTHVLLDSAIEARQLAAAR